MANIRIDLNHAPLDGETVTFKAPCDASEITGLIVYYADDAGATASQEFTLNDANGGDIGVVDHIFAEGSIVKVILDTDTNSAFVQNPDTNTYLEGRLDEVGAAASAAATAASAAQSAADAAAAAAAAAQNTANNKEASGTAASAVNAHNGSSSAHSDIRTAVSNAASAAATAQSTANSANTAAANAATAASNAQTTANSKAPMYQYSTTDLTAGSSTLTTGTLYFVYE